MRLILSLIVALMISISNAGAATVRVFILADTADGSIGAGVKANSERMKTLARNVADSLGAALDLSYISGADFSCNQIGGFIDAKPMSKDDIVIFYYAGHGYRLHSDTSRFPRLACSRSFYSNPGIEDVGLKLRSRGAGLVLAIADACNSYLGEPGEVAAEDAATAVSGALKILFGRYEGLLVMSGSEPGQYSFYAPNGGFFSNQLFSAIAAVGADATWDEVIRRSTRAFETNWEQHLYVQQPITLSTLRARKN
jgi:hypothetical protein